MTRILKQAGAVICVLTFCLSGLFARPAFAQSAIDAVRTTSKVWSDHALILQASVPVNSHDAPVQLTRAQLWRGLAMRARAPGSFVPELKACHILQNGPIAIVRACSYKGMRFEDLVTLFPMKRIRFQSLDDPENHSLVENLIEGQSDASLVLRFRFVFRGGTQRKTEKLRAAFAKLAEDEFAPAVTRTLARIRELALTGKLPARANGHGSSSPDGRIFQLRARIGPTSPP